MRSAVTREMRRFGRRAQRGATRAGAEVGGGNLERRFPPPFFANTYFLLFKKPLQSTNPKTDKPNPTTAPQEGPDHGQGPRHPRQGGRRGRRERRGRLVQGTETETEREKEERRERRRGFVRFFFSLSFFDLDQLTTSFLSFPIQFYLKQQKQRERQQKYLKALAMESKPGPKTG